MIETEHRNISARSG